MRVSRGSYCWSVELSLLGWVLAKSWPRPAAGVSVSFVGSMAITSRTTSSAPTMLSASETCLATPMRHPPA